MKQAYLDCLGKRARVASFAGAWIETRWLAWVAVFGVVASFAGAWIETSMSTLASALYGRRLLRGGVD